MQLNIKEFFSHAILFNCLKQRQQSIKEFTGCDSSAERGRGKRNTRCKILTLWNTVLFKGNAHKLKTYTVNLEQRLRK